MVIGTALGWGDFPTIALGVVLAFLFGYSLTATPAALAAEAKRLIRPRPDFELEHRAGARPAGAPWGNHGLPHV